VKGNSDYVYVGAGKKADTGADTVIAHEKPGDASDMTIGVVYADGHAAFEPVESVMKKVQAAK
jgi:hypothetical protein